MNDINHNDFYEVITRIETAKKRAFSKVNEELILLYWDIGHIISYKLSKTRGRQGDVSFVFRVE